MPVQKRSSENLQDDSRQRHRHHQQQQQQQVQHEDHEDENEEQEEQEQEGDDFDRSPSSSGDEDEDDDEDEEEEDDDAEEYLCVKLSDIRKEVQCPICLGIIRTTKTVMECLHRFCKECIDKSMRLGNNECPACRTHLASRRSLRPDPNFDALIATLYPDIDKYEEKELAFSDEEKTLNKHVQESIAETLKRQSEALGRRRTTAKDVTSLTSKPQGIHRRRGRRSKQAATKVQGSEDDEDENDDSNGGGRGSSSSDEQHTEVKRKRRRRWAGRRASQPSSTSANANVVCNENNSLEVNKEGTDASPGVVGTPEVLTWGKGGTRSHTRHGTVSGGNGRNTRSNNRVFKMVNYLRNLDENNDEV